jgi:hypothetical protein
MTDDLRAALEAANQGITNLQGALKVAGKKWDEQAARADAAESQVATSQENLTDALSGWRLALLHGRLVHGCDHTDDAEREADQIAFADLPTAVAEYKRQVVAAAVEAERERLRQAIHAEYASMPEGNPESDDGAWCLSEKTIAALLDPHPSSDQDRDPYDPQGWYGDSYPSKEGTK